MGYAVKEIFYSLQGEGTHVGRPAVFCRLAGCNLWSGREEDRVAAICSFCDTDFVGLDRHGGGRFATAETLGAAIDASWHGRPTRKLVVFAGGEPLLQLDHEAIDELHTRDFEVAVETNGTIEPPAGIDWICVSPKAGAVGAEPELYERLEFHRFFLQPMDGPARDCNTQAAVNYCLKNPAWRLSLQTHKLLGIP